MTPPDSPRGLAGLRFDNRFLRELPADPDTTNRSRQVFGACHSRVSPTPVAQPRLVAFSPEAGALIGLRLEDVDADELAAVFSGNRLTAGMTTYAACYGGHQFGSWAGQLGDGRAIGLGEVLGVAGAGGGAAGALGGAGDRWELQLKGAGRTPYSRRADGRAVMRSSVREFLCSEAMHHLGVPTTRALTLVATGEDVVRDLLYDGNARPEPGAIVCRMAPTFLRFGSFEILASRGETELLRQLCDHTIRGHFPHLGAPSPETYAAWLREICVRTAAMIVHWMRVGFVHGVMNTDNMSILGLTIDYGPYGWLEGYDPAWTPNITDAGSRRYRFENQPPVALWNLVRLANALVPLVPNTTLLEDALGGFAPAFEEGHRAMMAAKLGLSPDPTSQEQDDALVTELRQALGLVETDMTIFFRGLAEIDVDREVDVDVDAWMAPLEEAFYEPLPEAVRERWVAWLRRYAARVRAVPRALDRAEDRRARMNAVNPKYVLRNYLAQVAIDAAEAGDPAKVLELLEVLRRPYDEAPQWQEHARKRPEWARHRAGCSMLSCSS